MTSCLKTEVINATEEHEAVVEKRKKPFPDIDSTQTDTTRIPIGFDVSVEGWEEQGQYL